ncbi:chorismate synthase, partial [bacterium]|nr:chorismate synthase [bacterium]
MLEKFRFLTAGESHGKCLTAIIEGLPSGFDISLDFINQELKRRQGGYGRGDRMKIESDTVEITSGVRFGKTTGAPVTLVIYNKDYENWGKILSVLPEDYTEEKSFTKYRPGHADFAGSIKYNHKDLRNVLERSSARKTAIEVAVGAVAKQILKQFNINGYSKVLQIGKATEEEDFYAEIDKVKEQGDTLGGRF